MDNRKMKLVSFLRNILRILRETLLKFYINFLLNLQEINDNGNVALKLANGIQKLR